jgi:hypothetical protein
MGTVANSAIFFQKNKYSFMYMLMMTAMILQIFLPPSLSQ